MISSRMIGKGEEELDLLEVVEGKAIHKSIREQTQLATKTHHQDNQVPAEVPDQVLAKKERCLIEL